MLIHIDMSVCHYSMLIFWCSFKLFLIFSEVWDLKLWQHLSFLAVLTCGQFCLVNRSVKNRRINFTTDKYKIYYTVKHWCTIEIIISSLYSMFTLFLPIVWQSSVFTELFNPSPTSFLWLYNLQCLLLLMVSFKKTCKDVSWLL